MPSYIPRIKVGNTTYKVRDEESNELLNKVTGSTRNLWRNPTYNDNGIMLTENLDGSVHLQGTPTAQLYIDYYFDTSLPTNNYVLSCTKKGTLTGQQQFFVCMRNSGNTGTKFIEFYAGTNYGEKQFTSFAPYRCEIIVFANTTYNCDLYIQLETGTKSTSYIPPVTAIDYAARETADDFKNGNVLLMNARNYVDVIAVKGDSNIMKYGLSSGVLTHSGTTVHYSLDTASNGGFFTDYFSSSDFALPITRIAFNLSVTSGSVRLWLYGKMKSGGTYANVIARPTTGYNEISVDFAYYDVYTTLDIRQPIQILFTNGGEQVSDFTVTGLVLQSLVSGQGYSVNYSETNLSSVLDNIVGMIPSETDETYLKSPDGNRWRLTIDDSGVISTSKVTPNKSVFIGNSLLTGWVGFGMAASDNQHDYYYYVTNRIHALDDTATYERLSNGNLEHSTNETNFNTAFDAIKSHLTSDLDLICIQLGDNVNTEEKLNQFEKANGSFDTMIDWIKTNCPDTRIVWVGTWYPSIHDWLVTACKSKGIQFIDILPLATNANKARLGDIVHRNSDVSQTLTGSRKH